MPQVLFMRKIVFQSFEDARKFAHILKIRNQTDWRISGKSGKFHMTFLEIPHRGNKSDIVCVCLIL